MPEYECKGCKFSTPLKSNYTNHLRTNKHIRNTNIQHTPRSIQIPEVIQKDTQVNEIKCKKCNKHFNFKQSMYRHIKYTCKSPDPVPVPELGVKELFCLLKKQREEFNKKLDYQTKQIEKLVGEKSETF